MLLSKFDKDGAFHRALCNIAVVVKFYNANHTYYGYI